MVLTERLDFGWLYGDIVAGLTVGIVVVPQSMSYAQVRDTSIRSILEGGLTRRTFRTQIATLPTQYGLYSAFVGVLIYCVSFLRLGGLGGRR